jgi:hypothetical protein
VGVGFTSAIAGPGIGRHATCESSGTVVGNLQDSLRARAHNRRYGTNRANRGRP